MGAPHEGGRNAGRETVGTAVAVSAIAAVIALGVTGATARLLGVPLVFVVLGLGIIGAQRTRADRPVASTLRDLRFLALLVIGLGLAAGVVVASLRAGEDTPATIPNSESVIGRGEPERESKSSGFRETAGFAPAKRPTYECTIDGVCDAHVQHAVFNSYVNAPNYGDERSFLDAKPAGDLRPGGYTTDLDVRHGDLLVVRAYIDNNADAAAARKTTLKIFLPTSTRRRLAAFASIKAANALPRAVSDGVSFNAPTPIKVEFERNLRPQVTYRRRGIGKYITKDVPSAFFPNAATLILELGHWNPGFAASGIITATVRVS